MHKTAIMICGHGSRDADAISEFERVVAGLKTRLSDYPLTHGFLEFAQPIIRDGLDQLVADGATRILALPGMLFAAAHAKNDIPSVLNRYAAEHPGLVIDYGRELAVELKLLRVARHRIEAAEKAAAQKADTKQAGAKKAGNGNIGRDETCLVVVGRGASDPDANANVSKVARMLWEGMGFAWTEVCYSGVTFPLTDTAFDRVTRLGFKRIIVFPYFLFTGVLVKRIYAHADEAAARHPEVEFVKAEYLNNHPLLIETFVERMEEILEGENLMNCKLCKYREQVIGFEDAVGEAQMSHHHHVEGVGVGHDHHHHHHGDGE